MEELSLGLPKTNPVSGREEDLNQEPPDYKSSALTTRPLPYLSLAITSTIGFPERSTVRMKWCINASHFKWSWIAGACPMYVTMWQCNNVTMCVPNVSQLLGGCWPVGYLQSVEELSLGLPKTNPVSGKEEDLNLGPPDYKSSALTTRPLPYLSFAITSTIGFPERSTVRMKWCINASHFKWSWIAGACPMYVTMWQCNNVTM